MEEKRMKMPSWVAIAAAGAFLSGAAVVQAADPMVERMERGRKALESSCSGCHKIDKPLAREMSRAEWDALLVKMTGRGARVSMEDKGLIIDYLTARHTFSSKCTVCHTKEQVYDREKTLAQWEKTVREMAARQPGLVSEGEARAIIAYLTVTLGLGNGAAGE